MRIVIVDDQSIERFHMKVLFKHCADVEVVGESDSLRDAAARINSAKPDAVFLDIELGGATGFDLLPLLNVNTHIVFVTLHNDYAIRAFQVNALDYLLKPVTLERLQDTLDRIRGQSEQTDRPEVQQLSESDLVHVRDAKRQALVPAGDIIAIASDGDFTRVYTKGHAVYVIRRRMKQWLDMLPATVFQGLDRKLIINTRSLREMVQISPTQSVLHLQDLPEPLEIGKTASRTVRQIMKEQGR